MAEYIEREAANGWLMDMFYSPDDKGCKELVERFNKAILAADVVPVRHASWCKAECFTVGNTSYTAYQCSVCHAMYQEIGYGFNYCPNCGARMDGET